MTRITLDLDDPTVFEVVRSWHRLDSFGRTEVEGRVSSSGNGVHLKVHGSRRPTDKIDTIRRTLGDDGKRVDIDRDPSEQSPRQVLFGSKPSAGQSAGEWTDDLRQLLRQLHPPRHQQTCGFDARLPRRPSPGSRA